MDRQCIQANIYMRQLHFVLYKQHLHHMDWLHKDVEPHHLDEQLLRIFKVYVVKWSFRN